MLMVKRFKARLIVVCLTVIGILVFSYGAFSISKSRSFQFFGGLTQRVTTEEKVIALTFDDAPTKHTGAVLDILNAKGIPATFYVVGRAMEQYPDVAADIVRRGHELGNHSYSHQRFLLKSPSFIATEIEKTNELIRATGYADAITFRPPNGKKLFGLPWYLHQHDIATIMWDVEPDTFHAGDAEGIFRYTIEHARPGSIILMHPFCDASCAADRDALPRIIDELQVRGYRFVTVSQLLTY